MEAISYLGLVGIIRTGKGRHTHTHEEQGGTRSWFYECCRYVMIPWRHGSGIQIDQGFQRYKIVSNEMHVSERCPRNPDFKLMGNRSQDITIM